MSKLGKLGSFFKKVAQVAPALIIYTPLAPFAVPITAAIQEAQALFADNARKREHVVGVAVNAALVAAQAGAKIDVEEVRDAAGKTVDAIIANVKLVKDDDGDPSTPA